MGSTAIFGLPYPEQTDAPNIPAAFKSLADVVDSNLDAIPKVAANAAGRPAHKIGRIVFQADDPNALYVSTGSVWKRYVSQQDTWVQSGDAVVSTNGAGGFAISFPTAFAAQWLVLITRS